MLDLNINSTCMRITMETKPQGPLGGGGGPQRGGRRSTQEQKEAYQYRSTTLEDDVLLDFRECLSILDLVIPTKISITSYPVILIISGAAVSMAETKGLRCVNFRTNNPGKRP